MTASQGSEAEQAAQAAQAAQALLPEFREDFPEERELVQPGSLRVMLASLEHSIPHLGCKAQAGGLGKVMDLVARHHPSDILMVHPKVKDVIYRCLAGLRNIDLLKFFFFFLSSSKGKTSTTTLVSLGHDFELAPLKVTVDDHEQLVRVFQCKAVEGSTSVQRGFLLLLGPEKHVASTAGMIPVLVNFLQLPTHAGLKHLGLNNSKARCFQ